jgi:hypothetical protein
MPLAYALAISTKRGSVARTRPAISTGDAMDTCSSTDQQRSRLIVRAQQWVRQFMSTLSTRLTDCAEHCKYL